LGIGEQSGSSPEPWPGAARALLAGCGGLCLFFPFHAFLVHGVADEDFDLAVLLLSAGVAEGEEEEVALDPGSGVHSGDGGPVGDLPWGVLGGLRLGEELVDGVGDLVGTDFDDLVPVGLGGGLEGCLDQGGELAHGVRGGLGVGWKKDCGVGMGSREGRLKEKPARLLSCATGWDIRGESLSGGGRARVFGESRGPVDSEGWQEGKRRREGLAG